jgi:hypothetical protein
VLFTVVLNDRFRATSSCRKAFGSLWDGDWMELRCFVLRQSRRRTESRSQGTARSAQWSKSHPSSWTDREVEPLIEGHDGAIPPQFKVVPQRDGRFRWELINRHGTPAARSMETFATEDEAAAGAEYVRQLISRAPIKRP